MRAGKISVGLGLLFSFLPRLGFAQVVGENAEDLSRIRVEEHVGAKIPEELVFRDESGQEVKLKEFLHHKKPVILNLVYFECPMLCTMVLNGVQDVLRELESKPGEDYQLLSVSINPRETPNLAAKKRETHVEALGLPKDSLAWRFLVGDEASIQALAQAVGFHYYYDEKIKQYAHPAVTFVLTEEGVLSRYLYGLGHDAKNMRLALVEAGKGHTGSAFDRLLLYCYRYDPEAKGYVLFARNLMRMGGACTVLLLGLGLVLFWRKERTRSHVSPSEDTHA